MFAAIIKNKNPLSEKQGEYVVKVAYNKGKAAYVCECEPPHDKWGGSVSTIQENPLDKNVRVFHSIKEAYEYCLICFDFSNKFYVPYSVNIIKRPEVVYGVDFAYGNERRLVGSNSTMRKIFIENEPKYAKVWTTKNAVEDVVRRYNNRMYNYSTDFAVRELHEEDFQEN